MRARWSSPWDVLEGDRAGSHPAHLAEVTNHREKAAKLLGISLRALQYKIKEYGIRE